MKRYFYLLKVILLIVFLGCTSKHDTMLKNIKSLEEKVRLQAIPDKTDGGKLVAAYTDFVNAFPSDSLAPTMLFNASRVAFALNDYENAVALLKRLTDDYPTSKPIPDAYVFYGFIMETIYQDYEKARYWYELFLRDYPEHAMAEDVRITIKNLGKTPDELVAEFLKNNEQSKEQN